MGTPTNWSHPEDLSTWMRHQEKRVMHESRRPQISQASDLLGPGFGPQATYLSDWNAEEARFNGFFYSDGDATNAPTSDPEVWLGLVISSGEHVQQVAWAHGGSSEVYQRAVHIHSNQMPVYATWEPWTGGGGGSSDPGTNVLLDYTATPSSAVAALDPAPGSIIYMKAQNVTQTWDFKSLSALPAGWSRRGISSETFSASGMSATVTAGQGWYYDIPGTLAQGFQVTVKIAAAKSAGVMSGAALLMPGSGTGVMGAYYSGPQGFLVLNTTAYAYGSAFTGVNSEASNYPHWVKLRYATDGRVYVSRSLDGTNYSGEFNLGSNPVTGNPNRIFLGSILGTDNTPFKVDTVTYSAGVSGGLQGWWDGSALQQF